MHDDIAVTVLFVSIAVEQDEFIDWIDDWFRQMEQYDLSEERMKLFRKVMALISYLLITYFIYHLVRVMVPIQKLQYMTMWEIK